MTDNLNPHSAGVFNAGGGGSGAAIKVTSISMMITAIFIFVVIIFILFLCLQAHYSLFRPRRGRRDPAGPNFVFSAGGDQPSGAGLGHAALASLPVTVYQSGEFERALECAVCLAEIADGEKARLLPKCNHGFHVECIDTWFRSNSTCPVCRGPVDGEIGGELTESRDLDGERTEISRPVQSTEMVRPPLPSSGFEAGVLRRSVSRVGSGGGCCSNPRVGDIEEGLMRSGEGGEGSPVAVVG